MAISSATPVYTWESCKGHLSLFHQDNKYSLSYETKDHQTSEISETNVSGISFENLPAKIDEFCNDYFFKVQQNGHELSIVFFESEIRDDFALTKDSNAKPVPKSSMGDIGFEFNQLEKKVHVPFSNTAPSYRRVCRGLNMEGKCMNSICAAFDKYVIVPKGLGEFRIAQELDQTLCPACDNNISFSNLRNLGFWNCKFTIHGKQTAPEEKTVNRSGEAEKKHYTTYQAGNDCTWTYLDITTTKPTMTKQVSSSCDIV